MTDQKHHQDNSVSSRHEPQLNLLIPESALEEPLWKSLSRQMRELFSPKKLPPLELESEPQAVNDIWSRRNPRTGALGSTGVHVLIAAAIAAGTIRWTPPNRPPLTKPPMPLVFDANDIPKLEPGKDISHGGGGGGDRDPLPASVGELPKFSMEQIVPPTVIIRVEHPNLPVEATIEIPPEVRLINVNMPNLGLPTSHWDVPSNGSGNHGGIGPGEDGGVGPGRGKGYGPGETVGTGGDTYHRGQGASDPAILSQVDPEFSEEARKAKFQGLCVLSIIVEPDGKPSNIRVSSSLGMGLDEKAIDAVKKWRFRPSMKNGHPVRYGPVEVDVDFHLY